MKLKEIVASTSAAVSLNSVEYDLGDLRDFAISAEFSGGGGDLIGTLKLQGRLTSTSAWIDITGSSQAVAASANHMWDQDGSAYARVRAVWTYTSGTGNVVMYLYAKENVIKGG